MSGRSWIILGNPANRRVTLFREALAKSGCDSEVVAWLDFLRNPSVLERFPDAPAILRIDSAGEEFEVERELLRLGAIADPDAARLSLTQVSRLRDRLGEIRAPRQAHLGLLTALNWMEELVVTRPRWQVLPAPADIAVLFDKRQTSQRYEALGVPVPERLDDVRTPRALRERVRALGWDAVFVKYAAGSSASCLGIYSVEPEQFLTTIEVARDGWFNSRRLREISGTRRLEAVLGFLLEEGAQVERAVPKARLDGAWFDCRVLVIGGEPVFEVVRQSDHPITNLHLGGRRGDLEAFRATVPPEIHAAAMESCRRIARSHRCLHLGIDLMYEEGFTGHRVLEANAFGDLLPNLTRDGLSVYEWEIRHVLTSRLGVNDSDPINGSP